MILTLPGANAVVYISDHFDNQADWVGKGASCNDPPAPWDAYGYYCSPRIHIDSSDDAQATQSSKSDEEDKDIKYCFDDIDPWKPLP